MNRQQDPNQDKQMGNNPSDAGSNRQQQQSGGAGPRGAQGADVQPESSSVNSQHGHVQVTPGGGQSAQHQQPASAASAPAGSLERSWDQVVLSRVEAALSGCSSSARMTLMEPSLSHVGTLDLRQPLDAVLAHLHHELVTGNELAAHVAALHYAIA